MRCCFVRDDVIYGLVKFEHRAINEEAAHALTKLLYWIAFEKHRESFGLRSKISEEF